MDRGRVRARARGAVVGRGADHHADGEGRRGRTAWSAVELGGDDYVAKPFSPKELLARVAAVLRRAGRRPRRALAAASSPSIPRARVTFAGAQVELTPKEFDLLHALMASAGACSRASTLLNRVWGYARATRSSRAPWTWHVRRLRAKLGDAGRRIATMKSVGYRLRVGVNPGARGYSKRYETSLAAVPRGPSSRAGR